MDAGILDELKEWFGDYVKTFRFDDEKDKKNIDLKIAHTRRVCREIITLGKDQGLNEDQLRMAEAMALFHDIGRFEQYRRYKTYCDHESEDHARLGNQILLEHDPLERLNPDTQKLILCVIANHNRARIDPAVTRECMFFAKLLRDADKLDIWKVVTDYYRDTSRQPNAVIELNLPDTPGISDKVYDDIMHNRIVMKEHIVNLNDFKLLQIGWIFDINFPSTFRYVKERHYIDQVLATLPTTEKISKISAHIFTYLEKMSLSAI